MAAIVGVVMVLVGLLVIVFRQGGANFINQSDREPLGDRGRPLGQSSSVSVLMSGVGLVGFGAWILWNAIHELPEFFLDDKATLAGALTIALATEEQEPFAGSSSI